MSSSNFNNAKISIIDLTGKVVLNTITTLSEKTAIPLNLESGLYILNIQSDGPLRFTTKLMVK